LNYLSCSHSKFVPIAFNFVAIAIATVVRVTM